MNISYSKIFKRIILFASLSFFASFIFYQLLSSKYGFAPSYWMLGFWFIIAANLLLALVAKNIYDIFVTIASMHIALLFRAYNDNLKLCNESNFMVYFLLIAFQSVFFIMVLFLKNKFLMGGKQPHNQ
jgi:hypothetical protein